MSIGNSPEILSQAILAGIILVGRLGVPSEIRPWSLRQVTVRNRYPNRNRIYVFRIGRIPLETETCQNGASRSYLGAPCKEKHNPSPKNPKNQNPKTLKP